MRRSPPGRCRPQGNAAHARKEGKTEQVLASICSQDEEPLARPGLVVGSHSIRSAGSVFGFTMTTASWAAALQRLSPERSASNRPKAHAREDEDFVTASS